MCYHAIEASTNPRHRLALEHALIGPFFEAAGRSVSRQASLRQMVAAHLIVLAAAWIALAMGLARSAVHVMGFTLLLAGVVEGALLIGWRLTQWPKSKALELILVSPTQARQSMLGEQAVGMTMIAFVVLSGAPILALAVGSKWLSVGEAATLSLMALTWGCVVGFGLTWWAYEPKGVRRIGERLTLAGVLLYLIVGGLAPEKTFGLMQQCLSPTAVHTVLQTVRAVHEDTPFTLIYRIGLHRETDLWKPLIVSEIFGLSLIAGFVTRAAFRLQGHYLDRHYSPFVDETGGDRGTIGDRPLAWHAVRRVSEYSGRINLWLALGASLLYSVYLIAGDRWPAWLGQGTFTAFETLGGPIGLTTVLVLLAGVPAAYQYGLWDSSVPERCKKLELLLLSELEPQDYLAASWQASWVRGRGYLVAATFLSGAAWWSGRLSNGGLLAGTIAAALLLAMFGVIGFRYLAHSSGSTVVGFLLSIGLPLTTWSLGLAGRPELAALLPPGLLYYGMSSGGFTMTTGLVAMLYAAAIAGLLYQALRRLDDELRHWYANNQGRK